MIRSLWLKFKRFLLPYPLALLGKFYVRIVLWTCRVEVQGLSNLLSNATKIPTILMLWHSRIALTCELFRQYAPEIPYTVFLSKSRDGEPIARLLNSYRNASSIRVAHDTRHCALREMIARLKTATDVVLITPDGPRGPRERIKEGIVMAAKSAEAQIIACTWEANRYWEMQSWDRFRIPKPFSKITIAFGPALFLPKEIETSIAKESLETALKALTKKYEVKVG